MKYVRRDRYTKPATPVDVLKLALEKEKSSYQFYSQMVKKVESPSLLRLLEMLKKAELDHISRIKRLLDK